MKNPKQLDKKERKNSTAPRIPLQRRSPKRIVEPVHRSTGRHKNAAA
jgi:hypothetical protein